MLTICAQAPNLGGRYRILRVFKFTPINIYIHAYPSTIPSFLPARNTHRALKWSRKKKKSRSWELWEGCEDLERKSRSPRSSVTCSTDAAKNTTHTNTSTICTCTLYSHDQRLFCVIIIILILALYNSVSGRYSPLWPVLGWESVVELRVKLTGRFATGYSSTRLVESIHSTPLLQVVLHVVVVLPLSVYRLLACFAFPHHTHFDKRSFRSPQCTANARSTAYTPVLSLSSGFSVHSVVAS